jgi:DeoR family transcriptional regulator of aga operon
VAAKRAIGVAVGQMLSDGETVLLDIGTTTMEVARALQGRSNLTVITPSIPIANLLADEPGMRVICLGGVARPGERSLVGSLTEHAIRQFFVDVCVLGIGGLDVQAGLTEFNLDDAAIKQVALERSRRLIVAADASKLGTVAFAAVAPSDRIDVLVTDADPTSDHVTALRGLDIDIRTV